MLDDSDAGARVGVWTVFGIITLLLFGLIGGLAIRQSHKAAAPAATATTTEEALLDGPVTGDLAGTVFFASGAAALPADAAAEVAKVKAALDAAPTKKLVLSGYHDASGDPAQLAALDPSTAIAVTAGGRPAWRTASAALQGTAYAAELLADDAPYGVGYLVARWIR